jgi:hypothetical protein
MKFHRYAPDKNVGRKGGRTETISISPAAFSAGDNKGTKYNDKFKHNEMFKIKFLQNNSVENISYNNFHHSLLII